MGIVAHCPYIMNVVWKKFEHVQFLYYNRKDDRKLHRLIKFGQFLSRVSSAIQKTSVDAKFTTFILILLLTVSFFRSFCQSTFFFLIVRLRTHSFVVAAKLHHLDDEWPKQWWVCFRSQPIRTTVEFWQNPIF